MKILLVSESALEKVDERYFAVDSWIRFPLQLAQANNGLTILSPVSLKKKGEVPLKESWEINLGQLKIVPLEYYNSFVSFYKLLIKKRKLWKKMINQIVQEHDLILVRLPSPMVSLVAKATRLHKKPLVVFLAGDIVAQSDRIMRSNGLIRLFYKAITKVFLFQEIRACRSASRIYAYSKELLTRHKKSKNRIKLIRTPHLSQKDFVLREDTCQKDEIRLLRVCRFLPSKGIEYLIQAVRLLVDKGFNIQLELVGKDRTPGHEATLKDLAQRLKVSNRIKFSGWIPFDQMKDIFLQSDIQVISSLAEGTPRVILEGGAKGVPLVCTNVGGCKDNLKHEVDALLVPPADAQALAEAIARVITDEQLRQKLIQNGYQETKKATFEELGQFIYQDLKEIASQRESASLNC